MQRVQNPRYIGTKTVRLSRSIEQTEESERIEQRHVGVGIIVAIIIPPEKNKKKKIIQFMIPDRSEMKQCFDELGENPDCRVVVLSGAGKFFNAGIKTIFLSLPTQCVEE